MLKDYNTTRINHVQICTRYILSHLDVAWELPYSANTMYSHRKYSQVNTLYSRCKYKKSKYNVLTNEIHSLKYIVNAMQIHKRIVYVNTVY